MTNSARPATGFPPEAPGWVSLSLNLSTTPWPQKTRAPAERGSGQVHALALEDIQRRFGSQEAHARPRGLRVLPLRHDPGRIGNLLLQFGWHLANHLSAGDRPQFGHLLHADLRFARRDCGADRATLRNHGLALDCVGDAELLDHGQEVLAAGALAVTDGLRRQQRRLE